MDRPGLQLPAWRPQRALGAGQCCWSPTHTGRGAGAGVPGWCRRPLPGRPLSLSRPPIIPDELWTQGWSQCGDKTRRVRAQCPRGAQGGGCWARRWPCCQHSGLPRGCLHQLIYESINQPAGNRHNPPGGPVAPSRSACPSHFLHHLWASAPGPALSPAQAVTLGKSLSPWAAGSSCHIEGLDR